MKLNLPNDCDNSPKRKIIQELFLALIKCDWDTINNHLVDEVIWEIVGGQLMPGKEEIHKFLQRNSIGQIEEVTIDYILTHGKFGAVGGKIVLTTDIIHFADFFDFSSTSSKKISKIKTFVIIEPKLK